MKQSLKNKVEIPQHLEVLSRDALKIADVKVRNLITNHPDYFPLFTEGGKWKHNKESWTNWCDGFLGGQMWILADHVDEVFWRAKAEHYSRLLKGREFDGEVHDLGFTFWPTWKKWQKITGDSAVNEVVIQAGKTMSLRFNENAGFFRSFLAENSTFIDIMMNVGIIYYAAQQTKDDEILRKVNKHVLQSRRHLVRGDGSTTHEGIFDVSSGVFLHQQTIQGWRNDSTWARGQAWALYGFGTCYAFTGDIRFLEVAQETADYFIEHAGDQIVPQNDFEEPHPKMQFESSAGAIAASGLLQLSQLVSDPELAQKYANFAFRMIEKLCSSEFLASENEPWEGILKHGSYHATKKLGVDESVMWGEYFFIEALDKILGGPWVATEQ
jgi:unsaturated chondroitin disaccharide hydrolase